MKTCPLPYSPTIPALLAMCRNLPSPMPTASIPPPPRLPKPQAYPVPITIPEPARSHVVGGILIRALVPALSAIALSAHECCIHNRWKDPYGVPALPYRTSGPTAYTLASERYILCISFYVHPKGRRL